MPEKRYPERFPLNRDRASSQRPPSRPIRPKVRMPARRLPSAASRSCQPRSTPTSSPSASANPRLTSISMKIPLAKILAHKNYAKVKCGKDIVGHWASLSVSVFSSHQPLANCLCCTEPFSDIRKKICSFPSFAKSAVATNPLNRQRSSATRSKRSDFSLILSHC